MVLTYEIDVKVKLLAVALPSGPHQELLLVVKKALNCIRHSGVKVLDYQVTRIMEDGKHETD